MSDAAKDTIRRLLDRNPVSRLGSGPTGAEELKFSPFFSKLDFNRVIQKGYNPEFIPPLNALNFSKEFTDKEAVDTPVEEIAIGRETPRPNFEGFTLDGRRALNLWSIWIHIIKVTCSNSSL